MKNTKKSIIAILGATAIAFLMVSSATAVDQMNGRRVVNVVESQKATIRQNNNWLQEFELEEWTTEIDLQDVIDYITEAYQNALGEYYPSDFEENQELLQLVSDMSTMQEYSTTEIVNNVINNGYVLEYVETVCETLESDETSQYADIPFSLFDGILEDAKQFIINELGEDEYNQIYSDVSDIISDYPIDFEDYIFFLILREIAAIIAGLSFILFGHGIAGGLISLLLILTVITLPLAVYSVVLAGLLSLDEVISAFNEINLDDLIDQWGIIGAFVVMCFIAIPLALVCVALGILVGTVPLFFAMLFAILDYASKDW